LLNINQNFKITTYDKIRYGKIFRFRVTCPNKKEFKKQQELEIQVEKLTKKINFLEKSILNLEYDRILQLERTFEKQKEHFADEIRRLEDRMMCYG